MAASQLSLTDWLEIVIDLLWQEFSTLTQKEASSSSLSLNQTYWKPHLLAQMVPDVAVMSQFPIP